VTPASQTEAAGAATATYTVTYAPTNLTAAITPTVSGYGAGVSPSFSPASVVSTGGSSVATLTASGAATVGTTSLVFGGTSGTTTAATATASLVITAAPAPTGTLTLGTISAYSPQSLTGSTDWVVQETASLTAGPKNWLDRKLNGTIFTAGASDTLIGQGAGPFNDSALNWTDGTVTATGSSAAALEMFSNVGNGISFTLNSDSVARTLTVFGGNGSAGTGSMTMTASSSVAGIASVQHTLATGVVSSARAFTFNFQNAGIVTVTLAPTGATSNVFLAAATVTPFVPPAGTLTMAAPVPYTAVSLDSFVDWVATLNKPSYANVNFLTRKSGGTIIANTLTLSTLFNTDNMILGGVGPANTWTGASDASTGSSVFNGGDWGGTFDHTMTASVTTDTASHTLIVYGGKPNQVVAVSGQLRLTAHLTSGSSADVVSTFQCDATNNAEPLKWVITYRDSAPGTLQLTFTNSGNADFGIQAIGVN